jgi:hypothetical protein
MDDDKVITAIFVDVATAAAERVLGPSIPLGIYPNPSPIGNTNIVFRAPSEGHLDISVFDVTGHMVRRLTSGSVPSGIGTIVWNGRDESDLSVAAGTYFVRMTGQSGAIMTKRVVLIR